MSKKYYLVVVSMILILIMTSCDILFQRGDSGLESTRVALAIQQTSLVLDQTRLAQAEPPTSTPEPPVQPTYTPYPTYTDVVVDEPTMEIPTEAIIEPTEMEPDSIQSFEDWLKDTNILVYNDMWGSGEPMVIENAIDALGLGKNTTNVRDAMGHLLTNMNSATKWDLIIIAAESRRSISGEYFDVLADQIDRGTSVIIEIWYIDDIAFGRIQPVMQRCGIAFHRDWWREVDANLNAYLVYLLEPEHPVLSEPNSISMLIPYDVLWWGDVGDLVKVNPGSNATLLGGTQAREHNAYGLITECLDGRMIWQTFSTHDYRTQEMTNLWQNYIYNTLMARYTYVHE